MELTFGLDPSRNLSSNAKLDLDDLASSGDPRFGKPQLRLLSVLRLSNLSPDKNERADIRRALLADPLTATSWPPKEAAWFAMDVIQNYDPIKGDQASLLREEALLKGSVGRLSQDDAEQIFYSLLTIARGTSTPNWIWDLIAEMTEMRSDDAGILLAMGLLENWSESERPEQLTKALALADQTEGAINRAVGPVDQMALRLEKVQLYRAETLLNLARQGESARWDEAERSLKQLSNSPFTYVAHLSYYRLVQLLNERGRFEQSDNELRKAQNWWPEDNVFATWICS